MDPRWVRDARLTVGRNMNLTIISERAVRRQEVVSWSPACAQRNSGSRMLSSSAVQTVTENTILCVTVTCEV
jgi:hypothetical protein